MDKLTAYRTSIRQLLQQYQQYSQSSGEIETEIVTDTEHDHYQLLHVGWQNTRRVYGCAFHLDIKNGKVWIQYNGTDRRIAEELVELGIPKEDIVLGFQTPYRRQFTDYAVS